MDAGGKADKQLYKQRSKREAHRQTGKKQLTGYAKRQRGQDTEMQTDL